MKGSPSCVVVPLVVAAIAWCGPTIARAECGDAVLDPDESCDLGIGNEVGVDCTTRCVPPSCGDGHVDVGEACDDGNPIAGDGCSDTCVDEAKPLWSTTIDLGESNGTDGETFSAIATTSTGYVVGGFYWHQPEGRGPAEQRPLVAGFDHEGTQLWLDMPESAAGIGYANVVLALERTWVGGTAVDGNGDQRPMLWSYDEDGSRVDTIDLSGLEGTGTLNGLIVDDSGRVFAGGAHAAPSTPETGWIGELDLATGSLLWWVDTVERRRVADLAPMHDGRIAAAGFRSNVLWAGVVDDAGVAAWTQELYNDYPIQERGANAVAVAADDTIYVAGFSSFYVTNDYDDANGWLGAFSPDGDMLWMRDVSGEGLEENFKDVLIVDDRPVAIGRLGTAPVVGSGTSDVDVWVQGFDTAGEQTWRWQFDGAMHHVDWGGAALLEPDGALTVVGSSTEPYVLGDAWIARARPSTTTRVYVDTSLVRAPLSRGEDRKAALGPSATTLFLDFDGGTLRPGTRGDLGEIPCLKGTAPYPGVAIDTQQAEAIADRVETVMDAYAVRVRWGEPPPAHLPRTTVMLGGEPIQLGLDASTGGFACVVDCADAWPWDLAFAFAAGATEMANTAAHEAGHTWGLDHVVDMTHIMYPLGAVPLADWSDDECVAVSDQTSTVLCGDTHREWCDEGEQNSRAELLAAFGPRQPDLAAPEVSIVVETDALAEGEPAVVEVSYVDDAGVPGLRLVVPELGWSRVVDDGATTFTLPMPVGRFTILAEAIDHAENTAVAMVEVEIGGDVPAADSSGSGDGGETTSGDAEGDESSSGAAQSEAAGGCGCASSGPRAQWSVWLLLLVCRRRRASSR